MSEESESLFLPEDGPADAGDIDIGTALEEAQKQIFGDDDTTDGSAEGQGTPVDAGESDSSRGAIDQIGEALRPALEYLHDTQDDPPERTGPYPAGGPH